MLNMRQILPSFNSAFNQVARVRPSAFTEVGYGAEKRIKVSEISNIPCDVQTSSSVKSDVLSTHSEHDQAKSEQNDTEMQVLEGVAKKRDEKMRIKTDEFTSFHNLNMDTRHDFYELPLRDISQKQSVRGRKRTNVVKRAKNLKELMTNIVVPEWEEYLVDKRDKENTSKKKVIRSDAVWKKLMRD